MRRFTAKEEDVCGNEIVLDKKEKQHIVGVLRMKEGDNLIVTVGDGIDHICMIKEVLENQINLEIIRSIQNQCDPKIQVTLFQGTPKRDKLEFIVQKATEIGISKIVPFQSQFSISKFDNSKISRLEKISVEATKQCGRSRVLEIGNVKTFKEMLESLKSFDEVLFAYEKEEKNTLKEILSQSKSNKIAIVVGTEGGFSASEAESISKIENVKAVTLGKRILRLETAAIYISSVVMYELEEKNRRET